MTFSFRSLPFSQWAPVNQGGQEQEYVPVIPDSTQVASFKQGDEEQGLISKNKNIDSQREPEWWLQQLHKEMQKSFPSVADTFPNLCQ